MAIKAKFPTGVTSITLSPLHQWDYGQELEIESEDLLATIVEVHFSCAEMPEAEAHSCSVVDGIATVKIPDACLEQTSNITAWLYEIEGTQGRTTKSIVIPVIGRARPNRPAEIPQDISNCYTELISEVNEAVEGLKSGTVTAKYAESTESAATAKKAELATTATTAQNANTANVATTAEHAEKADVLLHKSWTAVVPTAPNPLTKAGLYLLRFTCSRNELHTAVVYFNPELMGTGKGSSAFLVEQAFFEDGTLDFLETGYLDDKGRLILTAFDPDIPSEGTRTAMYFYIKLMGNSD